MAESIDFGGEKSDNFLQGVHSRDEPTERNPEGIILAHVVGHPALLNGLEQTLANLALSEARLARGLPVAFHTERT